MKTETGLIVFSVLIVIVVIAATMLGNYDPITSATARGEMQLALGHNLTAGMDAALGWLVKIAVGCIFTGIGIAAFNEFKKAYGLWKRNAQAGRWQPGPNANFQRQPTGAKLSRQDLLLLALSGRLPGGLDARGRVPNISAAQEQDDDELDIQI
jgi:hypothetical protein